MVDKSKSVRKKAKRAVPDGIVCIHATFNNTLVTVSDPSGGVISWGTAAKSGFKGSRKSTPYAAQMASEQALKEAKDGADSAVVDTKATANKMEQATEAKVDDVIDSTTSQ